MEGFDGIFITKNIIKITATTIWEASMAYIKGTLPAIATRKKEKQESIKRIIDKMKTLEKEYKTTGNKKKWKEMKQNINWIYILEIEEMHKNEIFKTKSF